METTKKRTGRKSQLEINIEVQIHDLRSQIENLLQKRMEIDADVSARKNAVSTLENLLKLHLA